MIRRSVEILLRAGLLAALAQPAFPAGLPAILKAGCPGQCRMGSAVTVQFSGLDAWINATPPNDPSALVLALNGRPLTGLHPHAYVLGSDQLVFDLTRTADNRDTWNQVLSKAGWNQVMKVGVGPQNSALLYGEANISFRLLPDGRAVAGGVIFLVVVFLLFLILAKNSSIIRDPSPELGGKALGSYSLARAQMAWWLFILVGCYGYIFAITGEFDSITPGVLILLGISAGTGLSSVMIDASKQDQRRSLQTGKDSLQQENLVLSNKLSATPVEADVLKTVLLQNQTRIKEIEAKLMNLPTAIGTSDGFLIDILRDDSGVSFHRFQMALWTLVLGFVFVSQVWATLAMPDFSANLLTLMGISSGTYVGFKIPDSPK
jgi:hypothetical protein